MEKHFPEDLKYTKDHEWCRVEGNIATIGITWHAQDQLGDIVYCELPEVGEDVSGNRHFGVVESVKTLSDLISPVSGKVVERNEAVIEAPEGLNEDMYGDGWLIKVEMSTPDEVNGLLDHSVYAKFTEEQSE
ncbi:MAG: glycine cleavage system protein GcvH [Myxococcales bacterium]|nr:glycine cleavage system protein GcvH [Myxococcales bacterium]